LQVSAAVGAFHLQAPDVALDSPSSSGSSSTFSLTYFNGNNCKGLYVSVFDEMHGRERGKYYFINYSFICVFLVERKLWAFAKINAFPFGHSVGTRSLHGIDVTYMYSAGAVKHKYNIKYREI